MDEIRLPQNVVNRFGRRWTARFAQMLIGSPKHAPLPVRGCGNPLRSPQVRRLLERSLRPQTLDRTLLVSGA